MDEIRLKKIEIEAYHLKRRVDDHGVSIKAMLDWKDSIEESTAVNKRMVEVGEGILLALGWVGMAAKWVAAVMTAFTAMWLGVKAIWHIGVK